MEAWHSDAVSTTVERLRKEIETTLGTGRRAREFVERVGEHGPGLFEAYFDLYGWTWDFAHHFEALLSVCIEAAAARNKALRARDRTPRGWLFSSESVAAMTYTERFTGTFKRLPDAIPHLESLGVTHLHLMPPYAAPSPPNDGGYAVESYRRTRSDLGTVAHLEEAVKTLTDHGIEVMLDFVANHTSDTHPWAEAAKSGDPDYAGFYHLFADRTEPDRFEPTLREIFPDGSTDTFIWCDDFPEGGRWVWSTFYDFQWDLNYRNPAVTAAMVGELCHVANLGVGVIRADATPFLWKEVGTPSENLPQAHLLISIFSSCLKLVAPSVALLSEAIVHPDDVARFIRPEEAVLGYNPVIMSSIWEALATRDVSLLKLALDTRVDLPDGCQWITYLRSHDDIGWGFADEDAIALGIDPVRHREFLNAFYAGEFPGSFAAGSRFQENPRTGDARISGTLAALAGLDRALETADPRLTEEAIQRIILVHAFMLSVIGIPLLYLGDELAQLNDSSYLSDPALAGDNRWMHRPPFPWATLDYGEDGTGPPGRVLAAVRQLTSIRKATLALGGTESRPMSVDTGDVSTIAFTRTNGPHEFLGVFNFSETSVHHDVEVKGRQAISAASVSGNTLGPYGYLWSVRSRG